MIGNTAVFIWTISDAVGVFFLGLLLLGTIAYGALTLVGRLIQWGRRKLHK